MLAPVKKIQRPAWITAAETVVVMTGLGGFENPPKSMFVGGCVRNELMEKPVQDIDIATQYTPEEVMNIFDDIDHVQVIPTGLDHGTVTVVFKKKHFEITTLRHDAITDGRHAKIVYIDDWVEDAMRRDFTMNTLLADGYGNIYDPLGSGLSDIDKGRIVFVGDAEKRIQEDALRILRFFRFHAGYGAGDIDGDGLKACAKHHDLIKGLSRERIMQEFLKILDGDEPMPVLKIMFDNKVLSEIVDSNYNEGTLKILCEYQDHYSAPNTMARLFVLAGNKARFFDDYLRLSHAQKKELIKMDMVVSAMTFDDQKALKKAIFHHGNDIILQGYLLKTAIGAGKIEAEMIQTLQNWQAPECPITGQDLINEGYVTGPDLGQELERRQAEWLEEVL